MKYTTIFEKLLCIFDLISKSWLNIIFIGFAVIFIIMLALRKLSRKKCFISVISACLGLLICTIYRYFEPLSKMMDTLINDMFTNIYFPSAYAYLFILIVTDVVAIVNLLNPRTEKVYKRIHGICLVVINFVLAFILEMIAKYDIDIFSKKSLFSNTDFITLLEFSMNIFIIWLMSLLVVYLINVVTEHIIIAKERKVLNEESANVIVPVVEVSSEALKEEYDKTKDTIEVPAKGADIVPFTPDTTVNHFIPTFSTPVVEVPNAYHFENIPVVEQPAINEFVVSPLELKMQSNLNTNDYGYQTKFENTFDLSAFIPKKQEVRPINNFNTATTSNQIFEQILNNELPVIEEPVKSAIELEKDTYTLNDYRIFNKMLKDIREHNESNSISIDKNLEYRLITKYSTETYHMFQKMLKVYSN